MSVAQQHASTWREAILAMHDANLPAAFIHACHHLAQAEEGARMLLECWLEASSNDEREEVLASLQEAIEDEENTTAATQVPYVKFDELDHVTKAVLAQKANIRALVDRAGGVSAIAERAGMAQPALSRILNSASTMRRSTLEKLAHALEVDVKYLIGDFTF